MRTERDGFVVDGTTSNRIEYNEELYSSNGMHFTMLPVKGVHTQKDLQIAKAEIKWEP